MLHSSEVILASDTEAASTVLDKGKPVVRRGRKAMGSYRPK